jgi:hypothetical protein
MRPLAVAILPKSWLSTRSSRPRSTTAVRGATFEFSHGTRELEDIEWDQLRMRTGAGGSLEDGRVESEDCSVQQDAGPWE